MIFQHIFHNLDVIIDLHLSFRDWRRTLILTNAHVDDEHYPSRDDVKKNILKMYGCLRISDDKLSKSLKCKISFWKYLECIKIGYSQDTFVEINKTIASDW